MPLEIDVASRMAGGKQELFEMFGIKPTIMYYWNKKYNGCLPSEYEETFCKYMSSLINKDKSRGNLKEKQKANKKLAKKEVEIAAPKNKRGRPTNVKLFGHVYGERCELLGTEDDMPKKKVGSPAKKPLFDVVRAESAISREPKKRRGRPPKIQSISTPTENEIPLASVEETVYGVKENQ